MSGHPSLVFVGTILQYFIHLTIASHQVESSLCAMDWNLITLSQQTYQTGIYITRTLQMKKLMCRERKQLAHGHSAGKQGSKLRLSDTSGLILTRRLGTTSLSVCLPSLVCEPLEQKNSTLIVFYPWLFAPCILGIQHKLREWLERWDIKSMG